MLKKIATILFFCYTSTAFAGMFTINASPFTNDELAAIQGHLFANIATDRNPMVKNTDGANIQALAGAVLSSPSRPDTKFSQDYTFHWVRDAAITMQRIATLYENASPEEKQRLRPYLINYIDFESVAQNAPSKEGEKTLGQPKFNLNATVWEGRWARPQNDSPALRAITLMTLFNIFKNENDADTQNKLINMIRLDLDYIASEWNSNSYDLWEEMLDKEHFFTQIVQRKALLMGEAIFRSQDSARANRYASIAENLNASLQHHWRDANGYYSETISQQDHKGGGMNSAVLLGVLYGKVDSPNDSFALNDERVISTIYFLRSAFADLYQVNIQGSNRSPLIGRYPNDIYDGNLFLYGNPWILSSSALAEYYYRLASMYLDAKKIKITKRNKYFFKQMDPGFDLEGKTITPSTMLYYQIISSLIATGDDLLKELKQYATCYDNTCLHFSEQVDRASGKMLSAKDLTWGYTTILSAVNRRNEAIKKTKDF